MSKSGRVRIHEIRAAYRLIHDCRDVGHDPDAWPMILVGGIAPLVNAQVSICCRMMFGPNGVTTGEKSLAEHGWLSQRDRALWQDGWVTGQKYSESPTWQRFAALPGLRLTRSREQLAGDEEWYRSAEFNDFVRLVQMDDFVGSCTRIARPPCLYTLVVFRTLGDRRFAPRERRLIRLFHQELGDHLGKSLVHEPGPFLLLPLRLREILQCLLEGDGEKQVALRLGLSRHTVHDYVKDLHRRLGVSSRAELMALCLRHSVTDASVLRSALPRRGE
jgi:DNA-binding CsgD family transcriptional regulator